MGRNYMRNYLTAFKKSALLFVTHSNWGGWHHTEVHNDLWWRSKFESHGFIYSEDYTKKLRSIAQVERGEKKKFPVGDVNYDGARIAGTMMVFINPLVASRPEHAHLFAEPGCFVDYKKPNVHCGEEKDLQARAVNSPIPEEYKFIPYKEEQHLAWEQCVKDSVNTGDKAH